jgi:hypothetical protein
MLVNSAKQKICYVLIFINLYVLICEKKNHEILLLGLFYFVLVYFGMLHFLLGQYDYQCQCVCSVEFIVYHV